MRGLKALNEAFGKAGANMVLRAFGEELAVNDGGRFDVAHLHGDEFAAQSDDRVALDGFLRDVQAVVNRLVFYQERADGQVVMQEGVYFAYGIGATFDEADRVALPRAKELQGDVPEPRVLSAVDAVAAIAELQDRGHRVVRIDPAFDSSAGRSGTGSDSKTGEVLQDILDEPLEASSPTTSNEHSWDRHPRPLVSFAAAARGGGWSLFGEAAVALGVAVMGVLFFGGPGVVVAEVMAAIVSPMLVMLLHHVWAHGPPRARAAIGFVVKAVVVLVVIAAILALAGSEAGADPATPGVARGPASGDPWVLAVPAVDVAPVAAFVETVAGPVMLVAVLAVAALAAAIVVVVIKRVSKYRQTGTSDDGRSFVLDREQPRFGGTQRILQVREVRTGDVYLFKEAGIDLRFGVMREAVAMAIAAESRRPVAPFAKGVFGGKTGLYQVKLASRSDLAGRPISSCPLTILLDLVRSHVQDYAMRNADAIPEHFLVMPNGNGVLEVDLGRAWKVWPADKLTVAEWTGTLRSAVYCELFDRIANGEYSVQTVDALYQASMEQVRWTESVSDEFWVDRLVQAFEQLPVGSPLRHRQDEFIAQELARKHGLDVAFSEFWRGIYNKLGHPMPSREGPVTQAGAIRDRR
jgi:hypothetical protein